MKKSFSKVFLIAGSEPLGSAGIQADIKAVSACGGFAAGAITCIVNEDTLRVKDIMTIPVPMVLGQAESFLEDVGAECVKTGMLYSSELIEALAGLLKRYPQIPLLVDPVMVSSAGDQLIQNEAIEAYKRYLFPLATLITPNRREAELLLGHSMQANHLQADLCALTQWGNAVVVKSVETPQGFTDYFYDGKGGAILPIIKEKIETKNVNGTGDTFASAIAAYMSRGYQVADALAEAEVFIQQSIEYGSAYGFGSGYGPVHPFFYSTVRFEKEDLRYRIAQLQKGK